jgi:uncharacterized protein YndB with AHSA1/START domain
MRMAEYELTVERTLDATPAQLWRTWTEAELIRQWWAPKPYDTPECEIDLRPGGRFFTRMTGPDLDFAGEACVLEVVPEDRIVWTSAMLPGFAPREFMGDGCDGFPFTAVHRFADAGDGKTRYTATAIHQNAADRDAHEQMGFEAGWGTCAEQMAEVARRLD